MSNDVMFQGIPTSSYPYDAMLIQQLEEKYGKRVPVFYKST